MIVKVQNDPLWSLVKSLTKAEKRAFKLYANRIQQGNQEEDARFIQLFDILVRLEQYDEDTIVKKLGDKNDKQLPNLKRHLYKQILTSLRLIFINKTIDIELREQLDFARILYTKGLYMQALRTLERTKKTAIANNQDILHLEILEFQKYIEARHITRSRSEKNKMDTLLLEASRRGSISYLSCQLSNLQIAVHGFYIDHGHATTPEKKNELRICFENHIPESLDRDILTFFEKIYLYQAQMWNSYIQLDIARSISFAQQWVNLFEISPLMAQQDPDSYIRGMYYLLQFLLLSKNKEEYNYYILKLEHFIETQKTAFNPNSSITAFVYLELCKYNRAILDADYHLAYDTIQNVLREIQSIYNYLDDQRLLIFHYKLAASYFSIGQYDQSLDVLIKLLNQESGNMRVDMENYCRLMHLVCHYRLGNIELVDSLLPALKISFQKNTEPHQPVEILLATMQKAVSSPSTARSSLFANAISLIDDSPVQAKSNFWFPAGLVLESLATTVPLSECKQPEKILL